MTFLAAVAGVGYVSETEVFDIDDSEFYDIELPATWVQPDTIVDALKVRGPENVWAWVDVEECHVWLPELPVVMRGWQLRQVTPAVSACFDRLVIHASASLIDGTATAFVGESGVGKSTFAWELLKQGYDLIADDLLPIRFDPGSVVPTRSGSVPLGAVCFLSRGSDDLAVTELEKVMALERLVRNGFGEHEEPAISAVQFDGYHRVADTVPCFDLVVPDDRERLSDVAPQAAAQVQALVGHAPT